MRVAMQVHPPALRVDDALRRADAQRPARTSTPRSGRRAREKPSAGGAPDGIKVRAASGRREAMGRGATPDTRLAARRVAVGSQARTEVDRVKGKPFQ